MDEIRFQIKDLPPAKSEAKSMLAESHSHQPRVEALLEAARKALTDTGSNGFGSSPVALEVMVTAPGPLPSDATNYLGGIGDVLEAKGRRGALPHLGHLAAVALYDDDRQIQEVHFTQEQGSPIAYRVRIWRRD